MREGVGPRLPSQQDERCQRHGSSSNSSSSITHSPPTTHPHGLQVKYKNVMKQYNLGPNGGILTSCNLFATRFDQVPCCLWLLVFMRECACMPASCTFHFSLQHKHVLERAGLPGGGGSRLRWGLLLVCCALMQVMHVCVSERNLAQGPAASYCGAPSMHARDAFVWEGAQPAPGSHPAPCAWRVPRVCMQVMHLCEKERDPPLEHIILDTPGQIEIFTWSASGQIITELLASSFPTIIV